MLFHYICTDAPIGARITLKIETMKRFLKIAVLVMGSLMLMPDGAAQTKGPVQQKQEVKPTVVKGQADTVQVNIIESSAVTKHLDSLVKSITCDENKKIAEITGPKQPLWVAIIALVVSLFSAVISYVAMQYQKQIDANTRALERPDFLTDLLRHLYRNMVFAYTIYQYMQNKRKNGEYTEVPSEASYKKFAIPVENINLSSAGNDREHYQLYLQMRNFNLEVEVAAKHLRDRTISSKIIEEELQDIIYRMGFISMKVEDQIIGNKDAKIRKTYPEIQKFLMDKLRENTGNFDNQVKTARFKKVRVSDKWMSNYLCFYMSGKNKDKSPIIDEEAKTEFWELFQQAVIMESGKRDTGAYIVHFIPR